VPAAGKENDPNPEPCFAPNVKPAKASERGLVTDDTLVTDPSSSSSSSGKLISVGGSGSAANTCFTGEAVVEGDGEVDGESEGDKFGEESENAVLEWVLTPVSFSRALRRDSSRAFSASAPLPLGSNFSFRPAPTPAPDPARLFELIEAPKLSLLGDVVEVRELVGDVGDDGKLGDEGKASPAGREAVTEPSLRLGREIELERVCECLLALLRAGVGGEGEDGESAIGGTGIVFLDDDDGVGPAD